MLLTTHVLILITSISLCSCLDCKGKCKCHGPILDCSSTGIRKPFMQMAKVPSNITTVDLKRNNISRLPALHLMYRNEVIKELKLWFNEIQKVETSMLGKSFPMLVVLQLHRNKIKHITRLDFIALNKLRILDLGENQIITIEKSSFVRLRNLKQLNLGGNRLQSLLPDTFTGLERLLVLKLNSNHLTILDQKWLHHMRSLEELFVKSNRIRYMKPFDMTWQKSLRKVSLSDNQIQYLPNLPAFENINSVNKAGEGWYLDLSGNPVTCNCFMPSLANYAWKNLDKAVCGIGMKCQLKDAVSNSRAQWTPDIGCNTSLRMGFFQKYLKMSECQEPQQKLKVSNFDVKGVSLSILECVASGILVPHVQIKRLNSDTKVSTQIAKNIAISYLKSNESVSDFNCIAENNVGSVRSSEWIESKRKYFKKQSPNKINKTLGEIFPITVFVTCTTVTFAITVAYVLMLFSEVHEDSY